MESGKMRLRPSLRLREPLAQLPAQALPQRGFCLGERAFQPGGRASGSERGGCSAPASSPGSASERVLPRREGILARREVLQHRRSAPEGKRESEKGMVLVLTLAVVVILATLVLEFIYLMRVEAEIAGNYRDRLKAHYLANSGVSFAYCLLRGDKDLNCDSLEEEWAQAHIVKEGEGIITYRIIDECGKFNINSLLTKEGKIDEKKRAILERLFELLEIDRELVDVVCDWLDKDDETGDFGAEEDYYAHLERPYSCKNGPLDTLEELFLLEGFGDAVFYGKEKERGSLEEYLTVWGKGKVNINTASPLVRQALHSEIDETLAQEMGEHQFKKVADLKEISGMDEKLYNEISPFITVKSSFFSVQARGSAGEARRGIKALWKREGKNLEIGYWRIM